MYSALHSGFAFAFFFLFLFLSYLYEYLIDLSVFALSWVVRWDMGMGKERKGMK